MNSVAPQGLCSHFGKLPLVAVTVFLISSIKTCGDLFLTCYLGCAEPQFCLSALPPSVGRARPWAALQHDHRVRQAGAHAERGLPWSVGSASHLQAGTHRGPRDTSVRLAQMANGFSRSGWVLTLLLPFLFLDRGILWVEPKPVCHGMSVLWHVLLGSKRDLCRPQMAVRFPG